MTGLNDIHSTRILIIDDCCDTASLLCELLSLKEYRAVSWTTSSNALLAFHPADSFGLLLLDMHMPVTSGLHVLNCLRNKSSQGYIKVIAMSGDQRYRAIATAAGACAFVLKPFDYGEVEVAVSNALSERQGSIAKPIGIDPASNEITLYP